MSEMFGMGFASSSVDAVLRHAADVGVVRLALAEERQCGRCIAAQDVLAVVNGHVVQVVTEAGPEGDACVLAVEHDAEWIARHVLLAWAANGQRHRAPRMLDRLFEHPRRARYVGAFSDLAARASDAVTACDQRKLGGCLNGYRNGFDEWSQGSYAKYARGAVKKVEDLVAGWKCPGAGGCAAAVLVLRDAADEVECRSRLGQLGWETREARVTGGLEVSGLRASCGHRVDLIGAADLGQDPSINEPGMCLAMAVGPRVSRLIPLPQPAV